MAESPRERGSVFWVDHVLNEVYIGNQWLPVDFGISTGYDSLPFFHYIKLLSFNDPAEVDFFNRYAKLDFYRERPYKYISIIEREPKY